MRLKCPSSVSNLLSAFLLCLILVFSFIEELLFQTTFKSLILLLLMHGLVVVIIRSEVSAKLHVIIVNDKTQIIIVVSHGPRTATPGQAVRGCCAEIVSGTTGTHEPLIQLLVGEKVVVRQGQVL